MAIISCYLKDLVDCVKEISSLVYMNYNIISGVIFQFMEMRVAVNFY